MKYKALVLDYDDTIVESARVINYPAYRDSLKILRPLMACLSFEDWLAMHSRMGPIGFFKDYLKFNDSEAKRELEIWGGYKRSVTPQFYNGIPEALEEYKSKGGIVTVASLSDGTTVFENFVKAGMSLDHVFGGDMNPDIIKPNPYVINRIAQLYNFDTTNILVVGDLQTEALFARNGKASFAAACWGHNIPSIKDEFKKLGVETYLETIDQFKKYILQ